MLSVITEDSRYSEWDGNIVLLLPARTTKRLTIKSKYFVEFKADDNLAYLAGLDTLLFTIIGEQGSTTHDERYKKDRSKVFFVC